MTVDPETRARAAAGDPAAFGALMTATRQGLHRFVRRYVGEDEEAYDVLQEAYAAAWLAIRRYDPARPFEAWLRAIALNKCRDWSRRRAVRRFVRGAVGLDAPEAARIGDDAPGPEAQADDRRRLRALDAALRDLPDALKAPLLLTALEGLSQAEAAALLGVSVKAVETRVARAREKLARALPAAP